MPYPGPRLRPSASPASVWQDRCARCQFCHLPAAVSRRRLANMNSELLLQSAPRDPAPHHHGHRDGLRVRVLARVLASSLDRQLAEGRSPRSSRALVVRARQIVSPARRWELAQRWVGVLDLARRPPVPRTPRDPLCRGRIAAAEQDVREMIAVLTDGPPIAARGAAMASWLLRDGTGPLHNYRSPVDLGAVVREATCQMVSPGSDGPAEIPDRDNSGSNR